MSKPQKMLTRDEQIALMMGGEERARAAFKRWLANPEFKAALHRHDRPSYSRHRPGRGGGVDGGRT